MSVAMVGFTRSGLWKGHRPERPRCHNTLLFITLSYESVLDCHGREAIHRPHEEPTTRRRCAL